MDITEQTHRVTINNKSLIICNNNKDDMSIGIGMCIFFKYLIVLNYVFIIFIYLITRQTMVTVGMIPRQLTFRSHCLGKALTIRQRFISMVYYLYQHCTVYILLRY